MSKVKVVGLFTYPVKGMQGQSHTSCVIDRLGFIGDRRFMIVDEQGKFVTQREEPKLAWFRPYYQEGRGGTPMLVIECDRVPSAKPPVFADWEYKDRERIHSHVWGAEVEVVVQEKAENEVLSRIIGRPIRLVFLSTWWHRPARNQQDDGKSGVYAMTLTSLADGFPFLLTSEQSLAEINGSLTSPVPMERFRPNIVVSGSNASFEEETWREFRIGEVAFHGMKRCGRCIVTTTDQTTGERMGKEPLATLARLRRFGKDACFGMNLNHAGWKGTVSVGDELVVTEHGEPWIAN